MNLLDGFDSKYLARMAFVVKSIESGWKNGCENEGNVNAVKSFYAQVLPKDPEHLLRFLEFRLNMQMTSSKLAKVVFLIVCDFIKYHILLLVFAEFY